MMNMNKYICFLLLLFLASCQSIGSRNLGGEFNFLDKNKDRIVTWDEYSDLGHNLFKKMDYNSDLLITGKEDYGMYVGPDFVNERELADSLLTASLKNHALRREIYDVNHDGAVTLEEYDAIERKAYNKIDMNKDDSITYDEYLTYYSVK